MKRKQDCWMPHIQSLFETPLTQVVHIKATMFPLTPDPSWCSHLMVVPLLSQSRQKCLLLRCQTTIGHCVLTSHLLSPGPSLSALCIPPATAQAIHHPPHPLLIFLVSFPYCSQTGLSERQVSLLLKTSIGFSLLKDQRQGHVTCPPTLLCPWHGQVCAAAWPDPPTAFTGHSMSACLLLPSPVTGSFSFLCNSHRAFARAIWNSSYHSLLSQLTLIHCFLLGHLSLTSLNQVTLWWLAHPCVPVLSRTELQFYTCLCGYLISVCLPR